MADDALAERLDRIVELIVQRGDATAALNETELAPLARLAAELRHCPRPEFTARLRAHLERRTAMSATLVGTRIREGFTTVTPYVRVKEEGLVDFLARVFHAQETQAVRGSAGGMHREVRIGDSMLMIGEGGADAVLPVRPSAFHVYVEDVDATFQRALAAGGVSLGAPEDRFYGERSGFIRDPFGNHWYIARAFGPSPVPPGLRTLTGFLHVDGAAAYIDFLKRAFYASEEGRFEDEGQVRHAMVRIGNGALELADASAEVPAMGGAFYLYVGDADLVYQQALAAGATSLWGPAEQPFGERMGGVVDPIGNQWFIARPV